MGKTMRIKPDKKETFENMNELANPINPEIYENVSKVPQIFTNNINRYCQECNKLLSN